MPAPKPHASRHPVPQRRRAVVLSPLFVMALLCALAAVAQDRAEPFERPVLEPWTGDFDEMESGRLVRILVPHSRAYYFLDGARERGVAFEVGRLLEKDINRGRKRGQEIHVTFIPVPHDELIRGLVDGRGDLTIAPLTITPQRSKVVDFSDPLALPDDEIVVTGPETPELRSLQDLSGREVWVRRSSSFHESLERLNRSFEGKGIAPVEIRLVDENLDTIEILELMQAGLIPITVMDAYFAERWTPAFEGVEARPDLALAEGRLTAYAFRKNSPNLEKVVNAFIRRHKGTAFEKTLERRYLEGLTWVRNPTTTGERRKLERTLPIFRKYGERYDLDPLLLAAMGYQESRLIQGARSPAGAIGVMQLLPSTGADMRVGDIGELDNNIHAGAKYIRLLMDRFLEGEIGRLDRHLLAFASYNAGPGRVRQLRRRAAREGLDPNLWFDNVEIVVARQVGRETVHYVSNIYKYYLAYTWMLAAEQREQERMRALRDAAAAATADGGPQ